MRTAFLQTLCDLAESDRRILLLTGDLGYTVVEPFAERFRDRFYNMGVAEQNMVGAATGLAEAGFLPFVYSIATFAALRPYEFLRNGPVLHRLPVRVVGVGGGLDYGHNGASHFGLEELGALRLQPGLELFVPADGAQARSCLLATWDRPAPAYYRLGKDDRGSLPGLEGRFEVGRAQVLRPGTDLLLLALGSAAVEAAEAAERLKESGVSAMLLLVSSLNPAPEEDLVHWLACFPVALTVEAHYRTGGLGSLACELAAERGLPCRIVRCGVAEAPDGRTGSRAYLYERFGLSPGRLAARALRELGAPPADKGRGR